MHVGYKLELFVVQPKENTTKRDTSMTHLLQRILLFSFCLSI